MLARPGEWHSWAPHLGGAWGLGVPEVEPGRRGFARLLGVVPVPAKVTQVTEGVSWSWIVGPMTLHHLVEAVGRGLRGHDRDGGPGPLEPALAETYGRAFPLLLRRLAREAEADKRSRRRPGGT